MTDERVGAAIRNWAGRLIANGIDYNDFIRTTAAIPAWEDWLEAWTTTAEMHIGLAEAALERDAPLSAGQAYLRASVSYHFSKFVWVLDPELNRRNTLAAVSALYAAHGLLEPEAERIEAAIEGGMVVANLRHPSGGKPAPLVVLIPGLDSTKEEFWYWESVFLERGMATVSLDGPGQGETGLALDIRPDYELAVTAILDALADRPDLDHDQIGAAGVSLGGHYVVRAAAFEQRIRALAGISGPYDFSAGWEAMPELTRETFRHHAGAADGAEAREKAAALSLAGVAERVTQPCLVVTGRLDRVIGWQETRRIADAVPGAEWVLYEEGTHVCNNIPYKYRPLVADWMRARLR
ncbi:MAG TPA: alpha/beta hydrolase [Solirubrobacteraceae bacterium]|jgi:2,6-dihydroxypseudooxynicotine hydrolase|nr:alpha/beta hydrolase [Solirubrobacteraceae bacterium]